MMKRLRCFTDLSAVTKTQTAVSLNLPTINVSSLFSVVFASSCIFCHDGVRDDVELFISYMFVMFCDALSVT